MIPNSHRYHLLEPIGEGGTAIVHRGYDRKMKRPVAIKRYHQEESEPSEPAYRAELETISKISHPSVVCCYDADRDQNGDFLVMELIEGSDVESMVDEVPFKVDDFLEFARQCLEGLHSAHCSGVLHLDLKPSNIMITDLGGSQPIVKLIDFGRAQHVQDENGTQPRGAGIDGSIYYMAPEQFLGGYLDRRTDLYALGCIFYWCLSGQRPFYGDNAMVVMAVHLQHNVKHLSEAAPDVPDWLADWVMSLMEFQPEKRPSSARQALLAFEPSNIVKLGA